MPKNDFVGDDLCVENGAMGGFFSEKEFLRDEGGDWKKFEVSLFFGV